MRPPRGIRRRRMNGRDVYEINFYDQRKARRYEIVGPSLREARRQRDKRLAEVKAGTYAHGGPSARMLLDELADRWVAEKTREGMRSLKDAEGCYRNHVAPALGRVRVEDVTPRMVAELVAELARGPLAAKTVRNIHGTLHAILELARFEELIVANPASLPRGKLPKIGKKKKPRFSREELWQLVTDPSIATHRRVFYAMQGLGGLRLGEASGRRWRDLDAETPELWALLVDSQYEDQPLKTDDGEDTRERIVPVHPALRAILERWRREGYPALYGRHPTPEDWLAPDPKTGAPRSQNQAIKALYRDLDRIGIPRQVGSAKKGRACHAFRHAFISLARSDGARRDVLERVTHNAKGDVLDGYTDWEWTAMCEAVSCLRIDAGRAEVVELEVAREGSNDESPPPSASADGGGDGGGDRSDPCFSDGGGGNRTGFRSRRSESSRAFAVLDGGKSAPPKPREEALGLPTVAGRHHLERAAKLLKDAGHAVEARAVEAVLARLPR